jgi:hypothetical protein
MSRGTAADNSFTPVELDRLFETAARLDEAALRDDLQEASVTIAFLIYFLGYLGFRLGFALHFDKRDVVRNSDGEIIAIEVPARKDCERAHDAPVCSHCRELAKARARNADDDDVTAEDFYSEYWSPKSAAGNRKIPVLQERGRDIIELFLQRQGTLDMTDETVRRRVTRLAELTEEIDSDEMMPQSLRASAANYWITLEGFGPEILKTLMGWKYLSTAQYYVSSGFKELWYKMSRALGKPTNGPFDTDPEPSTYSEIRGSSELISVRKITPQGGVARHKYEHLPNPLEEEAQEMLDAYGDDVTHEANAASDPISAWTRARLRVEHAAAAASDKLKHYPPSAKRTVAFCAVLLGWATFTGILWGVKGVLVVDPISGQYIAPPGTIIGLVLGLLFILRNLPDLEDPDSPTVSE